MNEENYYLIKETESLSNFLYDAQEEIKLLLEENKRLKSLLKCDYEDRQDIMFELTNKNKSLEKQLQQKEDIINKAKKYINNNPLYDIDGYENNTYLSGIDDEQTRKELLEILDNKGE